MFPTDCTQFSESQMWHIAKSKSFNTLLFNFHLPSQNGIWGKSYHFWSKKDDEK